MLLLLLLLLLSRHLGGAGGPFDPCTSGGPLAADSRGDWMGDLPRR